MLSLMSEKKGEDTGAAGLAATKPAKRTPTFERTPKDLLFGAVLVLLGGIMWGCNATVSKVLMGDYHVDPMWLACVRELLAGVLFIAVAAVRTSKLLTGALHARRDWPWLIACSLVCVLLVQVAYLSSINWTNAGTATVLQALNLLFVLAYVCLRGRRWPGLREGVGVALAFGGTALIATGGNLSSLKLPLIGLVWGLVNALATAAMGIMPVKLIARWGNMVVNGVMFIVSGVVLLPVVRPWAGSPSFDAFGLLLMAYTVVIGTFGSFALYLAGVMRIGAMRATMLGTSEPIAATVSSVMFLGAVFTPTDLIGFVMILTMVFLVR